jgi:hypothetical protein
MADALRKSVKAVRRISSVSDSTWVRGCSFFFLLRFFFRHWWKVTDVWYRKAVRNEQWCCLSLISVKFRTVSLLNYFNYWIKFGQLRVTCRLQRSFRFIPCQGAEIINMNDDSFQRAWRCSVLHLSFL